LNEQVSTACLSWAGEEVKSKKANKKIGFFSLFTFTFLLLTLLTDPPATAGGTDKACAFLSTA